MKKIVTQKNLNYKCTYCINGDVKMRYSIFADLNQANERIAFRN